ncbi:hypothetical protein [Streptomyces sp. NPDC001435]|uniref:DUF7848 domain-containing protein n=1 Tax=unclassified Streptomyces TaxID=2593676 RepID=UPI0036B03E12
MPIEQDPTTEPEYEALCVSGDETDCGARSGTHGHPGPVEEWQRKHTQETRHLRYRRNFGDYAVLRQDGSAGARTCEHRQIEKRECGTHCRDCKRQLYL